MTTNIPEAEFNEVLSSLAPARTFSTYGFIKKLQAKFPKTWRLLEDEYGPGGKGAGKHYSAFSRTSQTLHYWSERSVITKLDYRPAPPTWGSPVIRYWTLDDALGGQLFPNEVGDDDGYWEGARTQVLVNRYERDLAARKKCVEHHGARCSVCGFYFGQKYGERGKGFIHVHHRKPLSEIGEGYSVDPIKDLVPVCPNCHAMLHCKDPGLTTEDLKKILC